MKTSRLTARFPCLAATLLAGLLLLPISASAWNAAGHRLVAGIAWEEMSAAARDEASTLLRGHPDYLRWQEKTPAFERDRQVFIAASTWPDEIRKDGRFYSAGIEPPTPLLEGFPDMERRASWHYQARPLDPAVDSPPVSGRITRQLLAQAQILGNRQAPPTDRRYALPWLIHMAGDVHQPLHVSLHRDAAGNWDRLGTGLTVNNPFNSRKPVSTLHAFWDDLPGPPWLRGERLDAAIRALLDRFPKSPPVSGSDVWAEESWHLARQSGYPPTSGEVPTLDEHFVGQSREIAARRVAEAGHRLGNLLNQLFDRRQK